MKAFKIVLIACMAATFSYGAVAGQDNGFSDTSALAKEQQLLVDQLSRNTGAKVRIKKNDKTGMVDYIGSDPSHAIRQPAALGARPTPEEAARGFLSVYGPLLGIRDQARELRVMRTKKADRGRAFVRFQQVYAGIPVFGGESIVQVDASNNIISAHSKVLPGIAINTKPAITSEAAERTALGVFIKSYQSQYSFDASSLRVSEPELWIYNPLLMGMTEGVTSLVWRIEITPDQPLPIREIVLVDAVSGTVLLHFNQNPHVRKRQVYDHNNKPDLPLPGTTPARSEDGPVSAIADVNNAYVYSGNTYDFYSSNHSRDSLDNGGMPLISTTRFCFSADDCPYANAGWIGPPFNQMIYGQGYASADDVVAHELTHGVTDYESQLVYLNQSGAINESFSDIWGEFVDLGNGLGNDALAVRWLMGEDIPGIPGGFRDMSDPPAFGDPDWMGSPYYYCGTCDQGGVHWNSGVGNKLAFLMTDGDTFNGVTVTGIGIDKVARIFYEAQANLLVSSSDYEDLANAIQQGCADLVGTAGITIADCAEVANAISAVEIMDYKAPTNLVKNPGFESGRANWTQYSSGSYQIVQNAPGSAPCGEWLASLGGYNNAEDRLYQDITIPSNATQAYLQFYYGIGTEEAGGAIFDTIAVEIRRPSNDTLLAPLMTLSNEDASPDWERSALFDLLLYQGQTIRLMFRTTTDGTLPTSFLVDDVMLKMWATNSPAMGSFTINNNAAGTASRTVTLNNTATGSPLQYMASEDPAFTGASWQTYSTAPSFVLSTGGGTKTIYFKVRNGYGESAPPSSDTIEALVPAVNSFVINSGAASTTGQTVTLNNTATNLPLYYTASEDPLFAGAIWQTYSAAPSFALSPGGGTKTIYFKVENAFDESAPPPSSATINALAPEVTYFEINKEAPSTTSLTVVLNNTVTGSPTHYMASEDPLFVGAGWKAYSAAPSFVLSAGGGTKTVYFKVKNIVGESATLDDDIDAPAPVVTSFAINAGAANTASATVKLNNTVTGSPTHYMASEDAGFVGAAWQTYSAAPSFILSAGGGAKTVYFKVKNIFDESAALNDDISLTGVAIPVVNTLRINANAVSTVKQLVTLNNTVTGSPTHYMASEDPLFGGAVWKVYSAAPSFTLSTGGGTKTVYFKVINGSGESAVLDDDIDALVPAVATFRINANALSTAKQQVTLNNTVTGSPTHYMASEDPLFAGATWKAYLAAPSFVLSPGGGIRTVYFKVQNAFAESAALDDTIEALAPAVVTFRINANALSTVKQLVTLNNTVTGSPTHYIASEDPLFAGATWKAYSAAPSFTLSTGAGSRTVYFKVTNGLAESAVLDDTIEALVPTVTLFRISSGAASTTRQQVTLNNTATGSPTQYMASEDPAFTGAIWKTYTAAPSFTLSTGIGTKTVYFKVQNGFDESAALDDTIEALAPVVVPFTFRINSGAASTTKQQVVLNNRAMGSPTQYMASEDPAFTGAVWKAYSAAPSFVLSAGSGTKRVYLKVTNGLAESAVENDTIVLNAGLPPMVSVFRINNGALNTVRQQVTLNNTATNSPLYYMASESSDFAGASWLPYSAAPSFALSTGSGTKTVYFRIKNMFGRSLVVSDTISTMAPVVSSLRINNGAASTASTTVKLYNTATGSPTQYMASEDPLFGGAAVWQAYATAPNFVLSINSGTKTVYFKVRNGFEEESAAVSDTILAPAPEVIGFKINNGAATTATGVVTLNNTATGSPLQYMASELDDFSDTTWKAYSAAPKFTLSIGSGPKTIYFKVTNGFEESAAMSDTILASGTAPVVTMFKINNGAALTASGTVTLNNTATNSPTQYMASELDDFSDTDWQAYAIAPSFTLSAGSGMKTVYFKVRNIFGESSVESYTIYRL